MIDLSGVRVIDLSRFVAGPFCAMLLGDYGADVVKVEHPRVGDGARRWGAGSRGPDNGYFFTYNRNKRSMTLDLQQPRGQMIARELMEQSDVLIHNFKVDTMPKLGLDYPTVRSRNPRLVYCEISGYGQVGPYRSRPVLDSAIQAEAGLMSMIGEPDGAPQKVPFPIVDLSTGLLACSAILAALYEREDTGQGTRVALSLLETVLAIMTNPVTNYLVDGKIPQRLGNATAEVAPSEAYCAQDGYLTLAVTTEPQWDRFCNALGRPDLHGDPRYRDKTQRVAHREILAAELEKQFAQAPVAHWIALLRRHDVPAAPVNRLDQVLAAPQSAALGLVRDVEHAALGSYRGVRPPISVDGTPVPIRRPPPTMGQHTAEVLHERLGLSSEEVSDLRAAGIV